MLSMASGVVGVECNDANLLQSAFSAYKRALIRVRKSLAITLSGSGKPDTSQEFLPLSCMCGFWPEDLSIQKGGAEVGA